MTNLTYNKTFSLQLFKGSTLLKEIKLKSIPVTIEAFKHQIRKNFKDNLQEKDKFQLISDDQPIENDFQLAQIPDRSYLKVIIIE